MFNYFRALILLSCIANVSVQANKEGDTHHDNPLAECISDCSHVDTILQAECNKYCRKLAGATLSRFGEDVLACSKDNSSKVEGCIKQVYKRLTGKNPPQSPSASENALPSTPA